MARPRIIKSPMQFDKLADEYFESKGILTLTGLILALGLSSRASLDEYEKRPEFFNSVKRAKMRIEHEYEKALRLDKNPAGPIFALKNFGWKDRQEIEHAGGVDVNLGLQAEVKKALLERKNNAGTG